MKTRNQYNNSKVVDSCNLKHQQNNGTTNKPSHESPIAPSSRLRDRKSVSSPSLNKSKSVPSLPMVAEKKDYEKTFNVLIGVTGSVATIKLEELTKKIKSMFPRPYTSKLERKTVDSTVAIRIVMTSNSKHFAPKEELIKSLNDPNIEIYDDEDEWSGWAKMGDPVLHIELRKWADLCLIAPLDANTMAKLACGLCDNLLTCLVRAWDISKPLVYCPAMNVNMYNHPMTKEHLCKLQSYGYLRIDCVEKRLACGDYGMGGMAPIESIADKVVDCLIQPITRKFSPAKPLLNQLPTYPILSTTEDQGNQNRSTMEDDLGLDFDPSKLLEQTMITDDTFTIEHDIRSASNFDHILSFGRNESLTKMDSTPLFDTSKFLALCQNKERGCFTCAICKHDYKNRKSMARHLKEQHVQGNIFHCLPCGVSYKRREKLIKHNRERHPEIVGPGS